MGSNTVPSHTRLAVPYYQLLASNIETQLHDSIALSLQPTTPFLHLTIINMGFLRFSRKKETNDDSTLCGSRASSELSKPPQKSKTGVWPSKLAVFKFAGPSSAVDPPPTSFRVIRGPPDESRYPLSNFKFLVKEPERSWTQSTNCYGSSGAA